MTVMGVTLAVEPDPVSVAVPVCVVGLDPGPVGLDPKLETAEMGPPGVMLPKAVPVVAA